MKVVLLPFLLPFWLAGAGATGEDSTTEGTILEWLPECFELVDSTTVVVVNIATDMLQCVQMHATADCLVDVDILTCVDHAVTVPPPTAATGNGGDFFQQLAAYHENVVQAFATCLEPYTFCVETKIQEYVTALPPCVNDTLRDLASCALEHADECQECRSADNLDEFWVDMTPPLVQTCSSLQTNVFDAICNVADCCEPCLSQHEAVWNCVLTQVLDYPSTKLNGDPCITCPVVSKRRQLYRSLATTNDNDDEAILFDECADVTPGVTGNTNDGPTEVLRRSSFFSCVSNGVSNQVATTTTTGATTTTIMDSSSTLAPTPSSDGNGSRSGAMLVLLGAFAFARVMQVVL